MSKVPTFAPYVADSRPMFCATGLAWVGTATNMHKRAVPGHLGGGLT